MQLEIMARVEDAARGVAQVYGGTLSEVASDWRTSGVDVRCHVVSKRCYHDSVAPGVRYPHGSCRGNAVHMGTKEVTTRRRREHRRVSVSAALLQLQLESPI